MMCVRQQAAFESHSIGASRVIIKRVQCNCDVIQQQGHSHTLRRARTCAVWSGGISPCCCCASPAPVPWLKKSNGLLCGGKKGDMDGLGVRPDPPADRRCLLRVRVVPLDEFSIVLVHMHTALTLAHVKAAASVSVW
jgi:hypothetical protein